jgi:hypothetical protein
MTVARVSSNFAAASNASTTTIEVNWPAATTSGDLLVACISTNDGSFDNPTGYTTAIEYDEPVADDMQRIVYKVSTGDSGQVQATNFVGNSKFITILEYSGTDTSSPLDQTATRTRQDGVTSSTVGPTGTLANADSVAVAQIYIRDTAFPVSFSVTDSFTLEFQFGTGAGTPWSAVADKLLASTTGPQTTFNWTTAGNVGGTIATFKGLTAAAPNTLMGQACL